jgi:hypothetical protein
MPGQHGWAGRPECALAGRRELTLAFLAASVYVITTGHGVEGVVLGVAAVFCSGIAGYDCQESIDLRNQAWERRTPAYDPGLGHDL